MISNALIRSSIQSYDARSAKKLLSLRLFDAAAPPPPAAATTASDDSHADVVDAAVPPQRWKRNVTECDYSLLCISQFTLYGQLKKGNKPDFHLAMGGAEARRLYEELLARLRKGYRSDRVHDGQFGALMQVAIVNDGPVTLVIDSHDAAAAKEMQQKTTSVLDARKMYAEKCEIE